MDFEIIVAGGGVSGSMAAIAASRAGSKVLVVEQGSYLGGTLTRNGVGPMMTFFAGETQVVKGIAEELVQRMISRGYSKGHVYDTTHYISYITPFNAEGMKIILDEMLEECGCSVLFNTFIGGVQVVDNEIKYITICNKDGISNLKAKVFIDATGDADISYWSGVKCFKGRKLDNAAQPMTMKMKYCNVDTAALKMYITENPDKFPKLHKNLETMSISKSLSLVGFIDEFEKAKSLGEISIQREDVLFFETNTQGEFIINTTRILNHDSTDAWSLSDAEKIGRKQCEELDKFFRKYIKAFANSILEFTGPSVGIRGSRQIQGVYTLTEDDIITQKYFESTIAHSGYPIDIHSPDGEGTNSKFFETGTYYNIPYEIMITNEIKNLLVTGRCISATFEAQASIRVTPCMMALGQASGIAAHLAISKNCDTRKVDIFELRKKLIEEKAFL